MQHGGELCGWEPRRLRVFVTRLGVVLVSGLLITAVEIGARLGARVVAVARGADKLAVARAAGAEVLIDSEGSDLKAAFKALGGVDVVYDAVGEPAAGAALRALRPEGRYIVIGFAGGGVPQFPANILLVKNIDVIGVNWPAYAELNPRALTASFRILLD